ncbi:MAG: lytic transglycosylase domain-containing protein, partial [Mesorhizobium sp.]
MPTRQPHFFALLGAILLLTPSLVAAGKVDVRVTSAIPMPNLQDAGLPDTGLQDTGSPSASVARLKSGLDALAANDVAGARQARETLPVNSLDRHILAWAIALYGGDKVPSGDIADAAKMLPNWPGLIALRKNSERALYRENPAPEIVVQAFGGSQPQTVEGVVILARSYVSLG